MQNTPQPTMSRIVREPSRTRWAWFFLLQAACVGSALALYANGQRLAVVRDGAFVVGAVGLAAEDFAAPQAVARYNAFVVGRP